MRHSICILGAVKEEIAGIKGRMKIERRHKFGKTDIWRGTWEGKRVILVRTGVGKKRAQEALTRVLDNFPISMVISIGYAGGTHPDLQTGDLLIADKVLAVPEDGKTPKEVLTTAPLTEKAVGLQASDEPRFKFSIHKGSLLTVETVIHRPEDKRALGERYDAMALDMETCELARIAAKRELEFLSVRAISDTVEQELVDVSSFMEKDGEISKLKAGWYVLTHPASLKTFIDLKDIAQQATKNLTEFLIEFLRVKN
ncbi:MAG: 5'-methylthioadenosine/S-adenosylhomocysteine nucleosidase [Nitrospinaceae bacterium]|nr:MAG: 5'-methylthioadenosine/S-adenosylhomocysteine nucleosidase [Nitrospinaceae bacterium]